MPGLTEHEDLSAELKREINVFVHELNKVKSWPVISSQELRLYNSKTENGRWHLAAPVFQSFGAPERALVANKTTVTATRNLTQSMHIQ